MSDNENPSRGEPAPYAERNYDLVTWTLAAALALFVLGAIGYGLANSSKLATSVPSLSGPARPAPTAVPRSDPQLSNTTGSGAQR